MSVHFPSKHRSSCKRLYQLLERRVTHVEEAMSWHFRILRFLRLSAVAIFKFIIK